MDAHEIGCRMGVMKRAWLGMTTYPVRDAVESGRLRRLRYGWYAVDGAHPDVATAVSMGGCLGCVDALRLHGVWTPPENSRLHVRLSRPKPGTQSCPSTQDIPIPSPVDHPRVAWASAQKCLGDDALVVAVTDSALRLGFLDRHDLGTMASRLRGSVDARAESGTESLVRFRLQRHGIRVRPQVHIPGVGRVDMVVGDRLIIECDSVAHHTSLENYHKDRRRDRISLVKGFLVMRLSWEDVMFHWDEVEQDILALVRGDRHRVRAA